MNADWLGSPSGPPLLVEPRALLTAPQIGRNRRAGTGLIVPCFGPEHQGDDFHFGRTSDRGGVGRMFLLEMPIAPEILPQGDADP